MKNKRSDGSSKSSETAAAIKTEVWKEYLSPEERAVLVEMAAEASGSETGPNNTDPAVMIRAMRARFAKFAALAAPPLSTIASCQFDDNGLKGLWFKSGDAAQNRALLYFHGGGYVVGSPETSAAIAGFLAERAGVTCFSLAYPLAPESPYPAAVNHALAAYRMLLAKGFKPGHIVLAGDSAGGGLVLATLLNLRNHGLPRPAGGILLSPGADLTHSRPSIAEKSAVDCFLNLHSMRFMASLYAAGHNLKNPLISPVFADLRGMPPLLIQVGSHEVLLDDALIIARNAAMADVPVMLTVWPGYSHVFQMFHEKLGGARKALLQGVDFIYSAIANTLLR